LGFDILALFFQIALCHARLFRISSLVPQASGHKPEFGFVWLCFSRLAEATYFHNPFSVKRLHSFGLLQIGFVFSN
jgi:hypothetical protein